MDELHRIIMDAAVTADDIDRNDVGMVQVGGRLGFRFEALQSSRIKRGREWQYFERDSPAQRDLFRFVNDTHAAAADLAQQAEVAQQSIRLALMAATLR